VRGDGLESTYSVEKLDVKMIFTRLLFLKLRFLSA